MGHCPVLGQTKPASRSTQGVLFVKILVAEVVPWMKYTVASSFQIMVV